MSDISLGLLIVDISNPQEPQLIGSYIPSGYIKEIESRDNLLYIIENRDYLKVIDVSNPNDLQILGSYETTGIAQSLAVIEETAYIVSSSPDLLCLEVLDVSNPDLPIILFDYPFHSTSQITGVYIKDNYLFVMELIMKEKQLLPECILLS